MMKKRRKGDPPPAHIKIVRHNSVKVGRAEASRGEIARGTGIDRSHISRIFSREVKPSLEYFILIAEFLNVSLDELAIGLGLISRPEMVTPLRVNPTFNKKSIQWDDLPSALQS